MGGCACSKAASSENLKASDNGGGESTDKQPAKKRDGSKKKDFSNIFKKPPKNQQDENPSNKSNNNNSEQLPSTPNDPLQQPPGLLSPNKPGDTSSLKRNMSEASWSRVTNNFYSLADLPPRTRLLLTSHGEFHDSAQWPQARINREIQVYQCSPFLTLNGRRGANGGEVGKHNLALIEAHLNSSADKLFIDLRRSCADHSRNCDLNLININAVGSDDSTASHSLAHNKYFRRMLGKAILGELLSTSSVLVDHNHQQTNNKKNYLLNYLPGYNLFEILLSEEQFKQQDRSGYVLSESISVTDATTFLSSQSSHIKDLFNKWYKLEHGQKHYRLSIDFLSLTSPQLVDQMQADLDALVDAVLESDSHMRQEYVKSVQQEEIEYIVKHADSASIIWINLTGTSSNNSSSINSANGADNNSEFNSWRYTQCLNLLVKKVLTNNYKQLASSEEDVRSASKQLASKLESALNEFVTSQLKCIIDSYVTELNKNYYQTFALKIDKQLAQEIYHHYELYSYLASRDVSSAPAGGGEQKLLGVLDEYLKAASTSHPLLLCNNDITDLNYFDLYVSKWMNKLIHENSAAVLGDPAAHQPISIVYRFANHTVLASEMATLIQSMLHQCSYLLEVHESTAFSTPVNSVDNLCKSLYAFQSALAQKSNSSAHRGIVLIVLNSIDKLLHTQHDLNLLVEFLSHVYKDSKSLVKLVMTVSSTPTASVGHQTPTKTSKLISQLFVKLENMFKDNKKVVVKLSVSSSGHNSSGESSSLYSAKLKQINELRDKLNKILFASHDAKLLDLLLYLLKETRFGLKQTEIIDLLNAYSHTSSSSSKKQHNHLIPILWYTFKYHLILFDQITSLTEFLIDDNRLLFKLGTYGQSLSSPPGLVATQFNDILHAYFAVLHTASSRRSSLASLGTDKQRALFASRAFHEHAKFFYLKNSHAPNLDQLYLSEFVVSGKWMLNKATACSGLLYFVNDLNFFKNRFLDEELADGHHHHTSSTIEKFKRFEAFFYDNFYALNQNPNEMDMLVRLSGKEKEFETVLSGLGNRPDQMRIQPLNRAELIDELAQVSDLNFALKKDYIHFSRVIFINKYTVLTLADQPHNAIKVWRVDKSHGTPKLILLRSIKLKKPPKDIKLFNEHQGVAMIERNLHLIDLDQCTHLADLNHTMNPNFPFFEIHDPSHVVVLSRNRLTVSLMELPVERVMEDGQVVVTRSSSNSAAPGTTAATAGGGFMFKVGEDRYLQSLLVSRNGKMMVCGDEVQKPFPLLVWDLVSRKLVHDLRIHNHEFITSIQAVSYSGKYVICACQESGESTNCLIVYDLTTGKMTKKLKSKSNYCSVEISEELDVIIACLENSQLFVYDLTTGSKKCAFNSNRYPINKIKVLTKNKSEKCHYFVTYDTAGYDWTIRLWDINKGNDQLVSSFTCPSRVVSLDANAPPFYFDESGKHTQSSNDEYYIAASLYGSSQLLLLRLAASTTTSTGGSTTDDKSFASPNLLGHHNEINL